MNKFILLGLCWLHESSQFPPPPSMQRQARHVNQPGTAPMPSAWLCPGATYSKAHKLNFARAAKLMMIRAQYDADGAMQSFVWHSHQKAICQCLPAMINLADDPN